MPELRRGYTTGMCAAAAAKAATIGLFTGTVPHYVSVTTPAGSVLNLEICGVAHGPDYVQCGVIKDGGDDPDVTTGLLIGARVRRIEGGKIILSAGEGVGVVTRPGLPVPPGEPAINPVPRRVIEVETRSVLPAGEGVEVTVFVPGGQEVARRTLNARLGIVGGISILGTTGIVEPMSEDAFRRSLAPQLDIARAHGYDSIVLTPGRMGERKALALGFPAEAIALMSNFAGYMLEECSRRGFVRVLLFGDHGKLVKIAAGIFHTHSRVADGRLETLAAQAGILGAAPGVLAEIMAAPSAEAALDILARAGLLAVYPILAGRASARAEEYIGDKLTVGTMILSREGELLGQDANALVISNYLLKQDQAKNEEVDHAHR